MKSEFRVRVCAVHTPVPEPVPAIYNGIRALLCSLRARRLARWPPWPAHFPLIAGSLRARRRMLPHSCHQLVTRVRWASPQVCVVDVWVDVRRPRHERPRADPPARQPLPSALAFTPPSVGFASGNGNQLSPFTPLTPTDATKTRRASKQVLVNMPSAPPRVTQRMGEGGWVEGQGDGHAEHGWS